MVKVAASILSADFSRLGAEVESVRSAGADYIHFDVMDGQFVPNISIGVPVLQSLRSKTDMFLDVHLMIDKPVRYVESFCKAGADLINIHVEADTLDNSLRAIKLAKAYGKKTGITLKPDTPAEKILPFLPLVDLILVMTVEPGFGGQSFMYEQLPKIGKVRELLDTLSPECALEVDGGINRSTAPLAVNAGADILVAGSYIFGCEDRVKAVHSLKEI